MSSQLELGTEKSLSQFCGNCDRYVFQTIYKHRIGSENERENQFVELDSNAKYKVMVENTATWSPFKGLLNEALIRSYEEGNLKNAPLKIGLVNVSTVARDRSHFKSQLFFVCHI